MQQLSSKIVELVAEGNYAELEVQLTNSKISDFSQILIESLKVARDSEDHVQCIKQILLHSKKINFNATDSQGRNPLLIASQKGIISMVSDLLMFPIEVKYLRTALNQQLEKNQDNWDIVEKLLSSNGYILEKPQHLIKSMRSGNMKTSLRLIQIGGVGGVDEKGNTCLHVAAELGLDELIPEILQREAEIDLVNKQDLTPIDLAANDMIRVMLLNEKINQLEFKYIKQTRNFETQYEVIPQPEIQTQTNIPAKQHASTQTDAIENAKLEPVQDKISPRLLQADPVEPKTLEDYLQSLTNEIIELGTDIEKKQVQQYPLINLVTQRITNTIKSIAPVSQVKVFGSCATGLFLPDSDIDLVVENFYVNDPNIVQLHRVKDALEQHNWLKKSKIIEGARTPVLKLTTIENIMVDITMTSQFHQGLQSALFVKDLLNEFTQLKYLLLALKYYFKQIGLLDSYSGGLNSNGLMIMTVALLQHKRMHDIDQEDPSYGQLFHDFLEQYGVELDYHGKQIHAASQFSSNLPNYFQTLYFPPNQMVLRSIEPSQLVVCDPFNNQVNVCQSTYKIRQIKLALQLGLAAIYQGGDLKQIIQASKSWELITGESKQSYYYFLQYY